MITRLLDLAGDEHGPILHELAKHEHIPRQVADRPIYLNVAWAKHQRFVDAPFLNFHNLIEVL
jgi:hypothetical protein